MKRNNLIVTRPILALVAIEMSIVLSVSLTGDVFGLSPHDLWDVGCFVLTAFICYRFMRK